MSKKKKRVLLATALLDGHNRGIKLVAKALRDSGIEVIYLGLLQTPEMILNAAIAEDVEIIGIGTSMGIHMTVFPDLFRVLEKKNCKHINIIAGGSIPSKDIPFLKKTGVKKIFGPGTPLSDISDYVHSL